jgi:hypothetical protein
VLNYQRVGTQRYFDVAGFPGRSVGLDGETTKQNRLISAIACSRRWLDEIITGSITDATSAKRLVAGMPHAALSA